MSNLLKTATLLLSFTCTLNLHAQVSEADQKGIEACYNRFMAAFEKQDAAAIGANFTENALHITPLGDIVRGRANIVTTFTNLFEYYKKMPQPDRTETVTTNWQNRYLANDLIMASYTSTDTHHFGDKVMEEKMSMVVVLRKQGDNWLAEAVTLTPITPMPQDTK